MSARSPVDEAKAKVKSWLRTVYPFQGEPEDPDAGIIEGWDLAPDSFDRDINATAWEGRTTLIQAVMMEELDVVRALLALPGIDVNKADMLFHDTPLTKACLLERENMDMVNALLAVPGIDVNQADHHGNTPLLLALHNGHRQTAQALLAVPGINVNAKNRRANGGYMSKDGSRTNFTGEKVIGPKPGSTALSVANEKGYADIVAQLRGLGAVGGRRKTKKARKSRRRSKKRLN